MPPDARIGPNAILQTITVLDRIEGRSTRDLVMQRAGVAVPPATAGMLPEADCAAVHRALRRFLPERADALLRQSGLATGDYILRHRIPRPVQFVLRVLPRAVAAHLLARAIRQHAWTFAGSGAFRVLPGKPLTFELSNNPLIRGETSQGPMCHWHVAVFERLFSALVWRDVAVCETTCEAAGDATCRFEIRPAAAKDVR